VNTTPHTRFLIGSDKDGCNVVPAKFKLEPDGRRVRRKLDRVLARTAGALDIETSKTTGEVPPLPTVAAIRMEALQLAGVVYTSHSHHPETNIRYRIILPLEKEAPPEIPAPDIVAEKLGLSGVLDRSKINAAALFYYPRVHTTHSICTKPSSSQAVLWTSAGLQPSPRPGRPKRTASPL
jgi:hypothetical protein